VEPTGSPKERNGTKVVKKGPKGWLREARGAKVVPKRHQNGPEWWALDAQWKHKVVKREPKVERNAYNGIKIKAK